MRCTRCDRWAVPQAVARRPDGDLVFGWCLDCLKETGCQEIAVARPVRGTRLPPPRALARPSRARPGPPRARIAAAMLAALVAWGLLLLSAGGLLLFRPRRGPASPFGNGTPWLLLFGGLATVVTALVFGLLASGRAWPRSPRATAPTREKPARSRPNLKRPT